MVLATKFTNGSTKEGNMKTNYQGNHSKSLKLSVARSLKKLQTEYIDLLWVHWCVFTESQHQRDDRLTRIGGTTRRQFRSS